MSKLFWITALLLFTGCQGTKTAFKDEQEMNAYLNDPENGFIHSAETSALLIEGKLSPAIRDDKAPQVTVQLRFLRKDGGTVLDIGNASKEEALEREGYLSFEVLKDVYLECEGKVIPAAFHHYERNYGLKPSVDVLFRFPNFTPQAAVYLNYRDQLFGQGLIRIQLEKELFTICDVSN